MILDELELHNFGVYGGRHTVELTPPSEDQPVVLIGALNGSGKTSFLQALHLALYGKRARNLSHGSGGYEAYLRDRIHDQATQEDGASVGLTFRHWREGKPEQLRVRRSWAKRGKAVREWVEVFRDGTFDELLTEHWSERVEEFLPRGLAHLFFFDAEKIADVVTDGSARDVLRTGVLNLLGLDLVEQLDTDLSVIERRKRMALAKGEERAELEAQSERVRVLLEERQRLKQLAAAKLNQLETAETTLGAIETDLRSAGGSLFDQREALETARQVAQAKLDAVEDEMRTLAAGNAPLLLVRPLLQRTLEQAERELAAADAEVMVGQLAVRDSALLALLEETGAKSAVMEATRSHLAADRTARTAATQIPRYLDANRETVTQLRALLGHELDATQAAVNDALSRAEALRAELDLCDRRLAQVPDRDAIAGLMEDRERCLTACAAFKSEHERLLADTQDAVNRHERELQRFESRVARQAQADHADAANQRTIDFSGRARETLLRFKQTMLQRHVRRIEAQILESYRRLLRKEGLVGDLKIDPETFEMRLFAMDGRAIPTERLSAGERQLLAVSMLWGLAQASGRALPAVIDTPLGRLDSTHRSHLVERYFPRASHQVLLLSTDEEIDADHLARLRPYIGRSYLLRFDEARRSTTVNEGYFWA